MTKYTPCLGQTHKINLSLFRTRRPKIIPCMSSGTSLYKPYKGVPPPGIPSGHTGPLCHMGRIHPPLCRTFVTLFYIDIQKQTNKQTKNKDTPLQMEKPTCLPLQKYSTPQAQYLRSGGGGIHNK